MAKRGRPRKDDATRKSVPLGVRVTQELRAQLDAAATEAGRSLSQEIEARLRLSFDEPQRAQDAFGGATNYWLFHQIAAGIGMIEGRTRHQWWADPYTFDECLTLLISAWGRFKPRGRKIIPKTLRGETNYGERVAMAVLAPLELALEGQELGGVAYAASIPVATKIKNSALRDLRADFQRAMNRLDRFVWKYPEWKYPDPDPSGEKGMTLGEKIEHFLQLAKKGSKS